MRILIDIGHPGHVHLFRPFAQDMLQKGNTILFTCRQKEFEKELLESFGFTFVSFGKHYNSKTGKIWGLIQFNFQMLFAAIKFKPDLFLSHGSIYAAQISWLLKKPHISMEDSGNMEQIKLYRPFTKAILTPDVLPEQLGDKQIRYKAYHEIAYLHPKYFSPDISVKKWLGLNQDDKYCILRFVSWKATHDMGHKGFSSEQKLTLINKLKKKFRIFITSEAILPDELKQFQIKLPPHQLHNALAFAEIVISEGATIASEAGVLGVPSIYVNSIVRSYNEDQEKYGTVFNFRSGDSVLEKIGEILSITDYKKEWQLKRKKLLADKIDLTAFLVWFIGNYPESLKVIKENQDYQFNFMNSSHFSIR